MTNVSGSVHDWEYENAQNAADEREREAFHDWMCRMGQLAAADKLHTVPAAQREAYLHNVAVGAG